MNTCTEPTTLLPTRRPGPSRPDRTRRAAVLVVVATLALGGCALIGGHTPATPSSPPEQPAKHVATPQERFDSALALMKAHQDAKAIAAFKALTVDVPDASGPFTNLGILHARAGHWAQAVPALQKAVSANAKNAVALNWLGIAERHLGHYDKALDAYRRALKIQPDNADAHLNLAILYDRYLHQPQQAIAQYQAYNDASGTHRAIVAAWIRGLQHTADNAPAQTGSTADKMPTGDGGQP